MAGIMMILFGLLKLGSVIRFIPYPLTVGFTSGIAVLIFTSQIKDFLGLNMGDLPIDFLPGVALRHGFRVKHTHAL
jgi:SulP family sulfate permease